MISFISQQEDSDKVHYVSVLQGDFMKMRLKGASIETSGPKIKRQYNDIIRVLKENTNNYFVNGNGFEKLITSM